MQTSSVIKSRIYHFFLFLFSLSLQKFFAFLTFPLSFPIFSNVRFLIANNFNLKKKQAVISRSHPVVKDTKV